MWRSCYFTNFDCYSYPGIPLPTSHFQNELHGQEGRREPHNRRPILLNSPAAIPLTRDPQIPRLLLYRRPQKRSKSRHLRPQWLPLKPSLPYLPLPTPQARLLPKHHPHPSRHIHGIRLYLFFHWSPSCQLNQKLRLKSKNPQSRHPSVLKPVHLKAWQIQRPTLQPCKLRQNQKECPVLRYQPPKSSQNLGLTSSAPKQRQTDQALVKLQHLAPRVSMASLHHYPHHSLMLCRLIMPNLRARLRF